jgi:sugar phosphate isomerase/epimerase
VGTVIETGDEVHRLMATTPEPVHLLLDTGHLTFAGADPAEFASIYRDRISHVHAKDVRLEVMGEAKSKDKSFLDAVVDGVYTVPGDGMVDYDPSSRASKDMTAGWSWRRSRTRKANPFAYAKLGYENLTRFLRGANLI